MIIGTLTTFTNDADFLLSFKVIRLSTTDCNCVMTIKHVRKYEFLLLMLHEALCTKQDNIFNRT